MIKDNSLIVAIDFGNDEIRAVVAQSAPNERFGVQILQQSVKSCSGIRRGEIEDVGKVAYGLSELIKTLRIKNRNVICCVTVAGVSLQTQRNIKQFDARGGKMSVTSQVIDQLERKAKDDVRNSLDDGLQIIDSRIVQYVMDQISTTYKRPVGTTFMRLEATFIVTIVRQSILSSICQSFMTPEFPRPEYYRGTTAMKGVVLLSDKEKEEGVALVDLGAQTVGVAVYCNGQLFYESYIPFGCESITNDISYGFNISADKAEKLKRVGYRKNANCGPLSVMVDNAEIEIDNAAKLNFVIVARLRELATYVGAEIYNSSKLNMILSVKLTGGGARMPGVSEIFSMVLGKDTSVATVDNPPLGDKEFQQFAACIGLASDIATTLNEKQQEDAVLFPAEEEKNEEESQQPKPEEVPNAGVKSKGKNLKQSLFDRLADAFGGQEGSNFEE